MLLREKLRRMAGVVLEVVVVWAMCGPAAAEEGEKKEPARKTAPAKLTEQGEKADPYAVPEGTAEELAKYIDGLLRQPPPDAEARKKAIEAMLKAADKVLAAKPNDDQALVAVRVKTSFLKSVEELEGFAAELKKAGLEKFARQVRGTILRRQLFEGAQEPGAANAAKLRKQIGEVRQFLAEGPLAASDVSLAMTAGQAAEMTEDTKFAAETYGALSKLLKASQDKRVAEIGETMEGVVRRLNLPGNEIKVEGKTLGGEPLDWSKYKGKVVLVDFWATWCGPCVAEVPNVKKLFEQYHDRGFDIVGVSLDRSREDLEGFIKEKEIPWTMVYNDGDSPTAKYYGVMSIPTMILVGKDGKVVSTEARGEELRQQLAKLLGPVKEEEGKKVPEGEKAAEKEK